jgi:5'(3')-deoxyribonucleotidase
MQKKFIFGVDLDGVCADFYNGIRPIAAEWLGVPEDSLVRDVSFGLAEWGMDQSPGGYTDFHKFAVTQRDLFRSLKPLPECPQVMRRLSKNGVHIRIITHRLFIKYFHQQAITQTISWLDLHGIPYWDLCFLAEKSDVGAHLYIDDAEKNIRALEAAGAKAIVFTNSTNRHLQTALRARTWLEVERLVMAEFQAWQERSEVTSSD